MKFQLGQFVKIIRCGNGQECKCNYCLGKIGLITSIGSGSFCRPRRLIDKIIEWFRKKRITVAFDAGERYCDFDKNDLMGCGENITGCEIISIAYKYFPRRAK